MHPGIEEKFIQNTVSGKSTFKKKHRHTGPLILYVGRQDPYKNILGLVQAFRRLLYEDKVKAILAIVGTEDTRYPDVRRFIKQYALQDVVLFTGYVSFSELARLYNDADVLALPSRYEGFGLPVLEAFATGTAVVASNVTSLPEVVGKAGILVDPDNVTEIKRALKRLITDDILRRKLIEMGKKRLYEFTWNKAGSKIVQVYTHIVRTF